MGNEKYQIRDARPEEFRETGALVVDVYSKLDGFPKKEDQPEYYDLLANIGVFTEKPGSRLLIALNEHDRIVGAVVYFGNMKYYGSGGTATGETNAAGFRLLAVDLSERGRGLGKLMTETCLNIARQEGQQQLIIHSTKAMQTAWNMYEKLGFVRSEDLDFMQGDLQVFGFRYRLK